NGHAIGHNNAERHQLSDPLCRGEHSLIILDGEQHGLKLRRFERQPEGGARDDSKSGLGEQTIQRWNHAIAMHRRRLRGRAKASQRGLNNSSCGTQDSKRTGVKKPSPILPRATPPPKPFSYQAPARWPTDDAKIEPQFFLGKKPGCLRKSPPRLDSQVGKLL